MTYSTFITFPAQSSSPALPFCPKPVTGTADHKEFTKGDLNFGALGFHLDMENRTKYVWWEAFSMEVGVLIPGFPRCHWHYCESIPLSISLVLDCHWRSMLTFCVSLCRSGSHEE